MGDIELKKKHLIANVVLFLQDEVNKSSMNEEKKESVEVAIQCLETAYEIEDIRQTIESEGGVDLLSLIKLATKKAGISEEAEAKAVEHKNKGNDAMRNSLYLVAVEEYTKAIELNPHNAVYFCNRAAAYSRLEKHYEAINDCKEAIKLDPTYGKAYGRLGIAYSNLNMYQQAREAYKNALDQDPGNSMYAANLKLAEERMMSEGDTSTAQTRGLDLSNFMNNPALINMATQMLSDPNFRNMMSGLMSAGQSGDPEFDALFQAGQLLANRMNTADPNFVESFRRAVSEQNGANSGNSSANESADNFADKGSGDKPNP